MSTYPNARLIPWTETRVRSAIEAAITHVQELGGNAVPAFSDELLILGAIEKFDSLNGVELLTLLSREFEFDLPDDVLHDPQTLCPVTLAQFVARVTALLNAAK